MTIHELYDITDYLTAVQESLSRRLTMASRRQQLAEIRHFAAMAAMLKPRVRDAGSVQLVSEIQRKTSALQSALSQLLAGWFLFRAA